MAADDQKRRAAARALDFVESGMAIGLGTGSTAAHFVKALGAATAHGLDVVCVPTSKATHELAASLDIPLTSLEEAPELDLTVDGADEFDPGLNLIKGGGGALLREKIVAAASRRMIVIADQSKQVQTLGAFPLPVEVVPFGAKATAAAIEDAARGAGLDVEAKLRMGARGETFKTDGGHLIYDCAFGAIPDPAQLATALNQIPGVVEHGLFIKLCSLVLTGTDDAVIEHEPG